ncbi:ATP-binding protein [Pseudonocardia sp.]|uniref:ATP-binding protein n=1 Tax=Pseudonocardia sp. TaxID=60912 RepID=UPI003D102977
MSLVGRTAQLAELGALLAVAREGRGCLTLVTGEPGVGKTRLVREVADRAAALGVATAWATCVEGEGAPALWPWTQLARAIATADPDVPGVGGLVARLRDGVADAETSPSPFRLFDAAEQVLRAAAARRAWLLVLDDLQWADETSLRLLEFLRPQLGGLRVAVLATAREGGARLPHAARIELSGLSADELAELIRPLGAALGPADAQALAGRTGGNPFYAIELARLARDHGPDVARAAVPGSVRAALEHRLAALPRPTRDVLAVAAVVGEEFRVDLLDAVGPRHDAQDLLAVAEHAGLVRPAGPGRAAFAHGLVRDAVHAALPAPERARLHGRVADALRAAGSTDPATLAHHLGRATGRADEAVRQHRAAARAATAVLAHADAARHLAEAVDQLDAAPGAADRGELLLDLAAARLAAGDGPGARGTYLAAARLARLDGRADRCADHLARAALGLGGGPAGFEVPRADAKQIALLEEAEQLLPDGAALHTRVTARLSVALPEQEQERRRALADRAVAAARAAADPDVLTAALAAHCDAIAGPEEVERREAQADEIVALATATRDVEAELLGRRLHLVALLERGDYPGADREAEAFALRVATIRHPLYAWYPPLWRSMRLTMAGRLDDGERQRALAETAGARVDSFNAAILAVSARWNSLAEAGRFAEGHAALAAFAERLGPLGPDMEVGFALAQAQAGRCDAARNRLDAVAPLLPGLPTGSEWPPVLVQVAELVTLLGGHPVAEWAYPALLPHRGRHGIDGIGAYSYGSLERPLGLLAAALGQSDTARAHLVAALDANERAGANLLVARTLRDAGAVLGDRALLGRAREAYRRLDVPHRITEVDALLGGPPAPDPAPTTGEFRRTGETWSVSWRGRDATVRDTKGMRDLARLLARPGTDVAAVELAEALVDGGDTGELVDATARDAYRARLAVLDDELAAADRAGDAPRSERASAERAVLLAQLSAAYGIGGRPRRTGDPAERARSAVGWRIRDALRRIEAVHPELARHLRVSVHTGAFCRYSPETAVRWHV